MAFTSVITDVTVYGNKRIARGTFQNTGGSTGGIVRTGLGKVEDFDIRLGVGASSTAPHWQTPLPVNQFPGDVTIMTGADDDGTWEATGL